MFSGSLVTAGCGWNRFPVRMDVANVLNKQLQTADRRWSYGLGGSVGGGSQFPTIVTSMLQNVIESLRLGQILWNDLRIGCHPDDLYVRKY